MNVVVDHLALAPRKESIGTSQPYTLARLDQLHTAFQLLSQCPQRFALFEHFSAHPVFAFFGKLGIKNPATRCAQIA